MQISHKIWKVILVIFILVFFLFAFLFFKNGKYFCSIALNWYIYIIWNVSKVWISSNCKILIRFVLEISILHYESNEDNNMEPVKWKFSIKIIFYCQLKITKNKLHLSTENLIWWFSFVSFFSRLSSKILWCLIICIFNLIFLSSYLTKDIIFWSSLFIFLLSYLQDKILDTKF